MHKFDFRTTHLMYSKQVHDERVLHPRERVDLCLDDNDRLLLEDGSLVHHLDLVNDVVVVVVVVIVSV